MSILQAPSLQARNLYGFGPIIENVQMSFIINRQLWIDSGCDATLASSTKALHYWMINLLQKMSKVVMFLKQILLF